ncbi:hypothetical protein V6Z11_D04G009100 [Gossypium hirsutum]
MTLLLKPITRLSLFQTHFQINNNNNPRARATSVSCSWSHGAHKIVREFDPKIPIEKAITPPSSWYTDPSFYAFELDRVFYRGWQAVGYTEQIQEPRDFFSGRLGNVEFVVCREDNGKIAAFHNGWTYGLNGELRKATRISGIEDFSINDFGLVPIKVATWGPFVLLNMDNEILQKDNIDTDNVASEWLGSSSELFSLNGVDTTLTYVCRREYIIECNWKIFEKVSIQSAEGGSKEKEDDRLGSKAFYAFIYPNFMINRYGPWMDTNLAIPLGPRKCLVVFDYFLEASFKDDKAFIERSLADSEKVQMEDIRLCEGVQKGIESPAYSTGRYAPNVEKAMHHFHCLLYDNLIN